MGNPLLPDLTAADLTNGGLAVILVGLLFVIILAASNR